METGECLSFVTLVSGTGIAGAMMSGPLRGDVQATVGRPFTATASCATIAIVDLPKLEQTPVGWIRNDLSEAGGLHLDKPKTLYMTASGSQALILEEHIWRLVPRYARYSCMLMSMTEFPPTYK